MARDNQNSYVAAEADYTAAIQRDGDNTGPYYSRGRRVTARDATLRPRLTSPPPSGVG